MRAESLSEVFLDLMAAWATCCGREKDMMDSTEIPVIAEPTGEAAPKTVARWRWWVHLGVLAAFPLIAGVMGYVRREDTAAVLPKTVGGLLAVSAEEMSFFGVIFGLA